MTLDKDTTTPDYAAPYPAAPDMSGPRPRRTRMRTMAIGILLALFAGAAIAVYALLYFGALNPRAEAVLGAESAAVAPSTVTDVAPARLANVPVTTGDSGLSLRMADLETRLARITVQADMASGNAARAEGLLIAFATRRALDSGRSLGYLDEQLQLRFGAAQPEAVAIIREFSANPITQEALIDELESLSGALTTDTDEGFWGNVQREFEELFLIRRAGTTSTASATRLDRARRFVRNGNVAAAVAEIEKMPGAAKAAGWLDRARRYAKVQEELEVLETAAIFEPKMLRDTTGSVVQQPSPVPSTMTAPAAP